MKSSVLAQLRSKVREATLDVTALGRVAQDIAGQHDSELRESEMMAQELSGLAPIDAASLDVGRVLNGAPLAVFLSPVKVNLWGVGYRFRPVQPWPACMFLVSPALSAVVDKLEAEHLSELEAQTRRDTAYRSAVREANEKGRAFRWGLIPTELQTRFIAAHTLTSRILSQHPALDVPTLLRRYVDPPFGGTIGASAGTQTITPTRWPALADEGIQTLGNLCDTPPSRWFETFEKPGANSPEWMERYFGLTTALCMGHALPLLRDTPLTGLAGAEMEEVGCLHAHLAHYLLLEDSEVGKWVWDKVKAKVGG